jgi:pimeloyl-ACP methyl ester carboxylesterase
MPYAAVNGLKMYHEVHGDGPPLLLLHGGSGSIPETWVPYFSPRFRVIAPEQMGHRRTADAMDRSFHYHDMAEDTIELIRQLQIESSAIVGYSDGGIIGLDIAISHPQRVTRLALTGVNARTDGYTVENQQWARTFDPRNRRRYGDPQDRWVALEGADRGRPRARFPAHGRAADDRRNPGRLVEVGLRPVGRFTRHR